MSTEEVKETANNIGAQVVSSALADIRTKYAYLPAPIVKDIFLHGFNAAQTVFRLTEKKVRTE